MRKSDRYRIIEEIGSGGMAKVYLAVDTTLDRPVALKVIHPHLLDQDRMVKRFENEARAIAQIAHENIIKLHDYIVEDDQKQFLVMEYVDGCALSELVDRRLRFPNLVLLELMAQVLSGLEAAHERGIFHRDIKPSNIMIDKSGCVKVMDFGIAYLMDQNLTMTGAFVGSPHYIAPEQAMGSAISDKTDIFSFGVTMYECATAQQPFCADNVHATLNLVVNLAPASASKLNAELLDVVGRFVDTCLSKVPSERPGATDALASLRAIQAEHGLVTGRYRLKEFLAEPAVYAAREKLELHAHFSNRGIQLWQSRQRAQAIRAIESAKQFGQLDQKSVRILDRMRGASLLRRAAAAFAVALLLSGAALLIGNLRTGMRQTPTLAAEQATPAAGSPADRARYSAADSLGSAAMRPLRTAQAPSDSPRNARLAAGQPAPNPSTPQTLASPVQASGSTGYLRIKTNPPWTNVYIDGVFMGTFPHISLVPVPRGRHRVALKNDKCIDFMDSIVVAEDDTVYKEVVLTRRSAP